MLLIQSNLNLTPEEIRKFRQSASQIFTLLFSAVYSSYIRGSRNILSEEKWRNFPERVAYNGAMAIAVQLAKMPATQHQKDTFLLDIDFFQDNLCGFTLRGLFRDVPCNDERQFKFFMRNMVVLSTGAG